MGGQVDFDHREELFAFAALDPQAVGSPAQLFGYGDAGRFGRDVKDGRLDFAVLGTERQQVAVLESFALHVEGLAAVDGHRGVDVDVAHHAGRLLEPFRLVAAAGRQHCRKAEE